MCRGGQTARHSWRRLGADLHLDPACCRSVARSCSLARRSHSSAISTREARAVATETNFASFKHSRASCRYCSTLLAATMACPACEAAPRDDPKAGLWLHDSVAIAKGPLVVSEQPFDSPAAVANESELVEIDVGTSRLGAFKPHGLPHTGRRGALSVGACSGVPTVAIGEIARG